MRRLAKYQTTVEVEGPEGSRKVHETYLLAEQALEALSRKLGTQKYFFGNKPSSLDVVVLSHLLLWLLERPPSDTLRRMAAKHQNLAAFCAAFRPVAFATQPRALAKQSLSTWISARYELLVKQLPLKSSAAKPFWKNFIPSKPVLNRIGSVVGVFVLFVAYVVRNGIVTIDFGGEEEEDAPPPKLLDINPADIPLDDYDYEYEYYDEMPEEDHMHGEEHDFGNGEEHDFGSDED